MLCEPVPIDVVNVPRSIIVEARRLFCVYWSVLFCFELRMHLAMLLLMLVLSSFHFLLLLLLLLSLMVVA